MAQIAGGYNASHTNPQPIIVSSNTTQWKKPQSNATTAGTFIFMSAGMNMTLAVGWAQYSLFGGVLHFCYSWFIGVIIGTILAIPLRMFISKKYIMATSIFLILVGGIIFTSVPYNYDVLLAARYINGIAVGLSTVAYLLHASEVAYDINRGFVVSLEQYSVTIGIALQMIYATFWSPTNFPINRLHGIVDIVFAAIGAFMLKFFIESPIDQIRMGNEAGALDSLARLQRPGGLIIEINSWLEHCKMYVRGQESISLMTSIHHAILPLVKMIVFRSMMLAFSFSLPLNLALQYSMIINHNTWTAAVAGFCRILGGVITIFLIDKVSRKVPSLLWVAGIGVMLIGLGAIFHELESILNSSSMITAAALYIVLQLFAGLFTPYTSVLLAEAFPFRVKGCMMDICVIVEQILQIILINTVNAYMGNSLMAQGIIIVLAFLLMIFCMPETRGTSLAEAQERFRNLFYTKLN